MYPLFYQSHFFQILSPETLKCFPLILKSSLLLCIKISNFLGAQGELIDADFVNATFQKFACGLLNSIVSELEDGLSEEFGLSKLCRHFYFSNTFKDSTIGFESVAGKSDDQKLSPLMPT